MSNPAAPLPDERLAEVIAIARADDEQALVRLDELLATYNDARLHFLRGSILAGMKRYAEAEVAMGRAVEQAPDFPVARFQFGFLKFTSGDAAGADRVWAPLLQLPEDNAYAVFVRGLQHLARDEFGEAKALLTRGMALNIENAPLNGNIALLISGIDEVVQPDSGAETSATHLLLQQYDPKSTRH